jgi:hypothetical protein
VGSADYLLETVSAPEVRVAVQTVLDAIALVGPSAKALSCPRADPRAVSQLPCGLVCDDTANQTGPLLTQADHEQP